MSDMRMAQIASMLSTSSTGTRGRGNGNWFEAMADAWGNALDSQAARIVDQADTVAAGFETPAEITTLTAESLRMSFISNSSHTSLTSVGTALETLARKQ